MVDGKLQPSFAGDERQIVGKVAIDLVRRTEDERGRRRKIARSLEEVERPACVDAEIRVWVGCCPIV